MKSIADIKAIRDKMQADKTTRETSNWCASSTADWATAKTTTEPSDFYKEYVSKWKW